MHFFKPVSNKIETGLFLYPDYLYLLNQNLKLLDETYRCAEPGSRISQNL